MRLLSTSTSGQSHPTKVFGDAKYLHQNEKCCKLLIFLVWVEGAKQKLWWNFKGEHQKKAFVIVSFPGGACLLPFAQEDSGTLQSTA